MNKVEFFGISGSGKTSFKGNIESKFKKKLKYTRIKT